MSAIFLIKISKGKIGTANPPFSANAKRFDLAVIEQKSIAFATTIYCGVRNPRNLETTIDFVTKPLAGRDRRG